MKIIRAQKQVKRIAGEIKELEKRAQSCLNTLKENEFKEEINPILEEIQKKEEVWIDLKTRIQLTNAVHNMTSHILRLGRLKMRIDRIREMKPRAGVEASDSWREQQKNEYKSQITLKNHQDAVKEAQALINQVTDDLDEFNAKTDIEELPFKK